MINQPAQLTITKGNRVTARCSPLGISATGRSGRPEKHEDFQDSLGKSLNKNPYQYFKHGESDEVGLEG